MPPARSSQPHSPTAKKRAPKSLLSFANPEDLLARYGGSTDDAVPEPRESGVLRERLSQNLAYFLNSIGQLLSRYGSEIAQLECSGGGREKALAALNSLPLHPVGRVIRLKLDLGDDEAQAEDATAAVDETAANADADEGADDDENDYDSDDDSDASSETPEPSADAPEVHIPDNAQLLAGLTRLKTESYKLGTVVEGVHDWLAMNMPVLEQGIADETGLSVMAAIMEKAAAFTQGIQVAHDLESAYLSNRATLEMAAYKYRDSGTAHLQLVALDRGTWDGLVDGWKTLSRAAILLYADVRTNLATLRKPLASSEVLASGAYM